MFSRQFVLKIFYQMVLILKLCHSESISHRDIKPDDIFLDSQLNIKLGDFGFSASVIDHQARSFVGTPFYMAPEIIDSQEYNFSCNIWSLGCIIYQLMLRKLTLRQKISFFFWECVELKTHQLFPQAFLVD
jgi:NIMA (never in mitosis gene a)-related kinase